MGSPRLIRAECAHRVSDERLARHVHRRLYAEGDAAPPVHQRLKKGKLDLMKKASFALNFFRGSNVVRVKADESGADSQGEQFFEVVTNLRDFA
jgi:hypothetical protein